MVAIEIQHLTVREIYNYLSENDLIFISPLSERLDIKNFAVKLNKFAVHFCARQNNELVGFSAGYFNNMVTRIGFISTFSVVRELQGKGEAKRLLNLIIEYGIIKEFKQIRLQVYISNPTAIKLYSESGFREISRTINQSEMALNLQNLLK